MDSRGSSSSFIPGTSTQRDASIFDSRPDRVWMNPISMSSLQRAVKARAKTVILNGKPFSITYGVMFRSKLTQDYECVMLKRIDVPTPSAPFGYVSMKRILQFEFEGDDT